MGEQERYASPEEVPAGHVIAPDDNVEDAADSTADVPDDDDDEEGDNA